VTSAFVRSATACGLLLCGATACGLVEDSSEEEAIPLRPRWLFLDSEEALTLLEFDDPRRPRLETRPPVDGCCRFTPDGTRMLLLGGTPETTLFGDAPEWEPSPLPLAEDYDLAYFLNATHFVARRLLGPQGNEVQWVFRDFDGTSFVRFGSSEELAIHGGVAVLRDEGVLLVRKDLVTVILPAPGLLSDQLQVWFDGTGQYVLLATRLEDAIDFGPLPDFVAHVEEEASPSCSDSPGACRPAFESPTWVVDSDLLLVRGTWPTSAGDAELLISASLGDRTALAPPETPSDSTIVQWIAGDGDAWVDAPSGRVRWATEDASTGWWTVQERRALDETGGWVTIADGPGLWVVAEHADFDLVWVAVDGIFHALDLASGREPSPVGPVFPYYRGWERGALVFAADYPVPCDEPCPYVAYADPSDPDAPVIRGTLDAFSERDYQWAPDQSGLLLRSNGWLYYHAFAAPNEPFRLARVAEGTLVRSPSEW
jgi:hypothetical protein